MNIVNIDVTIGEHYSHRHERAAVSIRQMFGFIENLQRREEQGAVGSLLVRGGAGRRGGGWTRGFIVCQSGQSCGASVEGASLTTSVCSLFWVSHRVYTILFDVGIILWVLPLYP